MPRVASVRHQFSVLSRFSLPSVNSYITFSAFLFFSGSYYYYRIYRNVIDSEQPIVGQNDEINYSESSFQTVKTKTFVDLAERVFSVIVKHRLLIMILLNTCCALVTFSGKTLVYFLFDFVSAQEESILKKTFKRFFQSKLTFLIFISHRSLFEDILVWMPWMAGNIVCILLLDLTAFRMSNAFNVVSSLSVRRRLFACTLVTLLASFAMMIFVVSIGGYLNLNYCLFLIADCCLILIRSVHLLTKLLTIVDASPQGIQNSNSSYHMDLIYDVVHDSIEFANYLHMIFFSQLALTYCCIFLVFQVQAYYGRISNKIRKHWQQQAIVRHISSSYVKATEEDLLKNESCTICWQPMKNARKLPCGHIFHELCLRRWLEQDSSCAICRKVLELDLNQARAQQLQNQEQQAALGEDVNTTLQALIEALSPHNNRLARWWTRILFESMNDEQITGMVTQVAEMFPQVPRDIVRELVHSTGSINLAVDAILDGRAGAMAAAQNGVGQQQPILPQEQGSDSELSTQESADENSSISESEEENDERFFETQPDLATLAHSNEPARSNSQLILEAPRIPSRMVNTWMGRQMTTMIELNRRKYLQSQRADDLRAQLLPNQSGTALEPSSSKL